jgi:hypothetical protein
MLQPDLVARLAWLAERDRAALIELLRGVDRDVLRIALGPADRDGGPRR